MKIKNLLAATAVAVTLSVSAMTPALAYNGHSGGGGWGGHPGWGGGHPGWGNPGWGHPGWGRPGWGPGWGWQAGWRYRGWGPGRAGWQGGYYVGAPVVYAPAPRYWVPGHYIYGGYWVPGRWAY